MKLFYLVAIGPVIKSNGGRLNHGEVICTFDCDLTEAQRMQIADALGCANVDLVDQSNLHSRIQRRAEMKCPLCENTMPENGPCPVCGHSDYRHAITCSPTVPKCPCCDTELIVDETDRFCPKCKYHDDIPDNPDETLTASEQCAKVRPVAASLEEESNNPFAYPQPIIDNQGRIDTACEYGHGGMTLRDYFAGLAMQSYITHLSISDMPISKHYAEAAQESYTIASAMLKARGGK
jgi:hypothetical protein